MIWSYPTDIGEWLPKLQCHRGYWVEGLLQNSLESVKEAYHRGYSMTEFDVRLTADQQVILFHDAKFGHKFIADTMYEELAAQIKVTTLRELLQWFITTTDFKLNIEIKNDNILNISIEKQVCDLIREYKIEDRVLISSFNPISLTKVRFFAPRVYRALLLSFERQHGNNWVVMSGVMNYFCYPQALHLRFQDYLEKKSFFKTLARKIPIVLWTVDEVSIYEGNKDFIFGVISDRITPKQFKY